MKQSLNKYRASILLTSVIITCFVLSCENKLDLIPKSDFLILPTLTGREIRSVLNDSGKIQLILISPLLEQYDNSGSPYSEFTSGIKVEFWDGKEEPVGSVEAKYAKYTSTNNLWELKDSVVVLNENGDKLETEVLNWDQGKDLIYTDRFVKITNEDLVTQGFGFESDSHLNKRKIKKVTAEIYLKDEE